MTEPKQPARSAVEYVRLFFIGIAMGSADVVPGVSGGTMAFILGIYEELLHAIKSFNLESLQLTVRLKVKETLEYIPWQFLLVLLMGIATAFLTLAHAVDWALTNQPVFLFAFFFGLILASILAVGATVRWSPVTGASLVGGTIVAYVIVGLVPLDMSHDPLTLFLSGMVAIMAMILPGISGSFILLILGQYAFVIEAVKELNLLALVPLGLGCIVGITGFARVLSWLLKRYEQATIAALVGFMIGSLRKIWPWKETNELVPKVQVNVLPDVTQSEFWIAVGLCVFGFILVSSIDQVQSQSNPLFRLAGRGDQRKHDVAVVE